MRNPFLKIPVWLNIIILIISVPISAFTLLFGFAHLIEGIIQIIERGGIIHSIGAREGWIIVISLCLIGIITLFITIGTISSLATNRKKK